MQAHPQSSSAARIYSSSSRTAMLPLAETRETATETAIMEATVARTGALLSSAGRTPTHRELSSSVSEGAGLAHDAGNLLQALGLYCELLQVPGVLRAEHRHYASELRQLAERSSSMISRLLKGFTAPYAPHLPQPALSSAVEAPRPSLARAESQFEFRPEPRPEPQPWLDSPRSAPPVCLNPAETLHQQSALLQRLAAPWAMISVMTQDALPGLEFSGEILERITVNLVLNAAEALRNAQDGPDPRRLRSVPQRGAETPGERGEVSGELAGGFRPGRSAEPKAGRIRVSLRMDSGRLRLSVEDNGPGMPPGIAAAFLRPSPLPPGTARGLGHRIVHELAMATGGQLSIRVRPGTGTTFSVDWPVKLGSQRNCEGPTLRLVSSHRSFADLGGWNRVVNGGLDAC